MTIAIPVKYRDATSLGQFVPGDQIGGDLVNGYAGGNFIINGGFDIWQRSTNSGSPGYSSVDRFVNNYNNGSQVLSQLAITTGGFPAGVYTPSYVLSAVYNGDAGAASFCTIQHRIENLQQFANNTLTFSMWIRSPTAGQKVVLEFTTDPGSGGSISGQSNNIGTTTFTIAAAGTWQYVTATVTIPSLVGSTLAAPNLTSLRFNLWLSSGANNAGRNNNLGPQSGTMYFAMLKLEFGSVATPFQGLPYAQSLSLCQRYYEKSYAATVNPGSATAAGISQISMAGLASSAYGAIIAAQFKAEKRIAPAVTWYSPVTGAAGNLRSYTGGNDIAAQFPNVGTGCAQIYGVLSSAATSFNIGGQWAADAEF